MAELNLVEVLPHLNPKCAMGRVVVIHSIPPGRIKPNVTGKIFFCCNRAYLTEASYQLHRASCIKDVGSLESSRGIEVPDAAGVCPPSLKKLILPNGLTSPTEKHYSGSGVILNSRKRTLSESEMGNVTKKVKFSTMFSTTQENKHESLAAKSDVSNLCPMSLDIKLKRGVEETGFQFRECVHKSNIQAEIVHHVKSSRKDILENGKRIEEETESNEECEEGPSDSAATKNQTTVTPSKTTGFKCEMCDYIGSKARNLKSHVKNAHVENGKFACNLCTCVYGTQVGLSSHLTKFHKQSKSLQKTSPYLNIKGKVTNTGKSDESPTKSEEYLTENVENSIPFTSSIDDSDSDDHKTSPCAAYADSTRAHSPCAEYQVTHKEISKPSTRSVYLEAPDRHSLVATWVETGNHTEEEVDKPETLPNACFPPRYVCNKCPSVFEAVKQLRSHYCEVHLQEVAPHTNTLSLQPISKDVNNIGTGQSGEEYFTNETTCKVIDASTATASSSLSGESSLFTTNIIPELQSLCSKCGFVAKDEVELNSHTKKAHVQLGVECVCGCSFASATELTTHINDDCRCTESKKENNELEDRKLDPEPSTLQLKTPQLQKRSPCPLRNLRSSDSKTEPETVESNCCNDVVATATVTEDNTTKRVLFPRKDLNNQTNLQCPNCTSTFPSEKGLRIHLFQMHSATTHRECEICYYPTHAFKSYKLHKKMCHVTNGVKCPDCPCSFKGVEGLSVHVKCLHKKKLDRSLVELKCHECSFIAYLQPELDKHVQRVHVQGVTVSDPEVKCYKCPLCTFTTFDCKRFESHKLTNHVENGIECDICNNTFHSILALRAHQTVHKKRRGDSENAVCKLCNYQCSGLKCLRQHKQRCHVKNGVSCPECPCEFKDVHSLSIHMRMVHKQKINVKDYLVKCSICGYGAISQGSLKQHNKTSHGTFSPETKLSKELFKCPICHVTVTESAVSHNKRSHVEGGRQCSDCKCSFSSERGLRKHLYLKHRKRIIDEKVRDPAEYTIKCNNCDFRCKSNLALSQHCSRKHGYSIAYPKVRGSTRKTCSICKNEFTVTRAAHNKYCHVENGFPCGHCCCTFETFKHRARHLLRFHKKKTVNHCTICGLKYSVTFEKHIKRSHVENGVKCEHCECTFESESGMHKHSSKMHKREAVTKQSMCNLCGVRLTMNLEVHMKRCHVPNSHQCTGCSCSFETELGKSLHMWKMHGFRLALSPKKCKRCGIIPVSVSMPYHLKHSHVEKGIKCSHCTCSFNTEKKRNLHMKKYHNVEQVILPKNCPKCNIIPRVPMKYHLKHSHVDNGLKCTRCICSFDSDRKRNAHLKNYHNVKTVRSPKTCEVCECVYTVTLREHMKNNHVKNGYPCSYCKCCFRNKSGRRCHTLIKHKGVNGRLIHMSIAHKKNKETTQNEAKHSMTMRTPRTTSIQTTFLCNYCSRSFTTEKGRSIHTKLVHKESIGNSIADTSLNSETQQFENKKDEVTLSEDTVTSNSDSYYLICQKCGHQAKSATQLNIHLQGAHVKNSPFPCTLCSCGYATDVELRRHKDNFHPVP